MNPAICSCNTSHAVHPAGSRIRPTLMHVVDSFIQWLGIRILLVGSPRWRR